VTPSPHNAGFPAGSWQELISQACGARNPAIARSFDREQAMNRIKRMMILAAALGTLTAAPIAMANLGASDDSSASDANLAEARKAIDAADWTRAIAILKQSAESHPDSADVQNFLGYAYRKSGDADTALRHYAKALEINPQHKHAHEYIGEAYLMIGDIASAEQHLAQLQKICTPIPCEEVRELQHAIEEHKKRAR
jgi:tetratricopeptide (TPR) repeat protein